MRGNPQTPTGGAMWLQWGQIQSQRAISCVCPAMHVCKHPCELFRWCLHAADWMKGSEQDLAPPPLFPLPLYSLITVLWRRWRALRLLLLRCAHKTPADWGFLPQIWDLPALIWGFLCRTACSIYRWVFQNKLFANNCCYFLLSVTFSPLLRRK